MATTKKPAAKKPAAKAAPAKAPATVTATKKAGGLDGFFKISERGSSIGTEIRGGLTTFFTMAYIVVLNPLILVGVTDATGVPLIGGGDDPAAAIAMVAAATALVAGVMTILMGFVANFPLALAAGLGLNAFVGYGLVVAKGYTWPEAMGMVVLEGIVVLLLVLTRFRIKVLYAVPVALKKAIAVGIGLFLAFIGLWDAGLVKAGAGVPTQFGNGGYIDKLPDGRLPRRARARRSCSWSARSRVRSSSRSRRPRLWRSSSRRSSPRPGRSSPRRSRVRRRTSPPTSASWVR